MAYLTPTTTSARAGLPAWISSAFAMLRREIKLRKLYRATFNGLNDLSNRELADLGLHRSGIPSVAWESARRAVD